METWEKKLEEVLAKENVYSFTDLNHQLIKWIQDWTAVIRNKDGMCASMSHVCNEIEIKTSKRNSPEFICSIYYVQEEDSDQLILRIVYSDCYYENKKLRDILNDIKREDNTYYYSMIQEDIHIYEEMIFEKEFVLNYLTLKFQNFLTKL